MLEGRYTPRVLFEYAATLGLIDVAYADPAGARDDVHDNWGTDELDYLSRYDGMRAIRINALGSYVLGLADQPPPAATPAAPIKVLPNHDVVALGELPVGDRMTLSAFADLSAERVWRLTEASMLAGIANGRHIDDLLHVLDHASDQGLPATVITLIADVRARCAALTDQGMVRLVECRDAATAVLIAREFALRPRSHISGTCSHPDRARLTLARAVTTNHCRFVCALRTDPTEVCGEPA